MDSFIVINQSCSNYLLSYPEYRYPSRLYACTKALLWDLNQVSGSCRCPHIYISRFHCKPCMHGMEVGQKVLMPIVIFACDLMAINTFNLPITSYNDAASYIINL